MQRELGEILANHRDHAGIVRPRTQLAEVDEVIFDEKLDSKQAPAAEFSRNQAGYPLTLVERRVRHGLRLPRLLIVATDLPVTDRRAVTGAARVANGQ